MKDARDISRALDRIKESCPMLNDILWYCKKSKGSDEPLDKWDVNDIERNVEEIRQINSELRQLCQDARESLADLENQIENANDTIRDLENEVESLKRQIEGRG